MKGSYDDIINMKYPFEKEDKNHPPMAVADRAKIFGSFAALKGHDEEIEGTRVMVEDMMEHEVTREVFYEDI